MTEPPTEQTISPHNTASTICKGFVELDGGRVMHYARRGNGPALVMLHAAPCSAKVMAPLQAEWGDDFTTFAFDLPGFGLSEMIEADVLETRHLADAVAGAVRALGLSRVALYGRHTGAGVAVEMARRHPDLCSMVLTDGYPVFPAPYSAERLKEYLLPIKPVWDGSHLVWAWFRYREQHMFWPWDRPAIAHRADTDVPDVPFLYRGTLELLESGENYPTVYASAFRHPGLAVIDEVTVPVCYGNRPGDSQFKTVARYPKTAWVQIFPRSGTEAAKQEREVLLKYPGASDVPPWSSRLSATEHTGRDYVATRFGPAYVRAAGLPRRGVPVLVLHDLPGSIDEEMGLIEELGRSRPVVGCDMIGNGNSDLPAGQTISIRLLAEHVAAVLDALGIGDVVILATGTAAAVAIELVRAKTARVRGIVFRSPPAIETDQARALAPDYAPDITPQWDGGNFLRLWHHLRDQELWWPWNCRTVACAKPTPPRIEPADLHRRAIALLRQPACYRAIWRAVLDDPLLERLAGLGVPRRLIAHEQDVFAFAAERAARALAVPSPRPVQSGELLAGVVAACLDELQ